MKLLIVFIVPIFYFYMSWFFPWDIFQSKSTISITYVFDTFFVLTTFFIFKNKKILGKLDRKGFVFRLSAVSAIGVFCILIAKSLELKSPFKYIEYLFIQILILAPIIEEFVFRGAFIQVFENAKLKKPVIIYLNAILFSMSHLPALWFLPEEFHGFIGFQLFYTLLLGWICAKSRVKTNGMLEPVVLHFAFNLIFYIAVKNFGI